MMLSNRIVSEGGFLQADNQVSVCLAYRTKRREAVVEEKARGRANFSLRSNEENM